MLRNYKFRLYPKKSQARLLERMLDVHRQLYNAALQERREAWQKCGVSLNYYDQANQLKELRAFDEDAAWLNYSSTQQTLRRLDKAFQAFFRRVRAGEKAGYPRFKSHKRWKSVEYRYGDGIGLIGNRLRIQNVGRIKIKLHRSIPAGARIKAITIKRESPQHWYAIFSLDLPAAEPLPVAGRQSVAGLDVGLSSFVALSNGETVAAPQFFRREEEALAKAQRRQSREQKGTPEYRARAKVVAKIHRRIRNKRHDFAHKLSRELVNRYQLLAFEDLQIKNMQRNRRLSKSIADAAWGQLLQFITYKAEEAGRVAIAVNPNGTSQRCSGCGETVRKDLSVRVHSCSHCGIVLDRDVNAARNILGLGLQSLASA